MTATPGSDFKKGEEAFLLRDIGYSSSIKAGADDPEEELMRAAHDPLLVKRVVLERQKPPDPSGWVAGSNTRVLPGVTLSTARDWRGTTRSAVAASSRYETPAGRFEPSLSPTVFSPAAEDREAAMDLNVSPGSEGPHRGVPRHLTWLGLGVLVLGVILLGA